MQRKIFSLGIALAGLLVFLAVSGSAVASRQGQTVEDTVKAYEKQVIRRLEPRLRFAGLEWPPEEVVLLSIKESQMLEIWAKGQHYWHKIQQYRIKGLSGGPGPKLAQGDEQVPEGFYRISELNPNSNFHLSMKLNYPNLFDKIQAAKEGRTNLGGDIYIHGSAVSKGCLAMGDRAIEDLFVLAARTGLDNIQVVIAPRDFRSKPVDSYGVSFPGWVKELHSSLAQNMLDFQDHDVPASAYLSRRQASSTPATTAARSGPVSIAR